MRNLKGLHFSVFAGFILLSLTTATAPSQSGHWHPNAPFFHIYPQHTGRQKQPDALSQSQAESYHNDVWLATRTTQRRPSSSMTFRRRATTRRFDKMSSSGRLYLGTIRIVKDTFKNYILGFCTGYAVGALVGLPTLLLRPAGTSAAQPLTVEVQSRLARMNVKSLRWALWLGEVLGAFKGCNAAVCLIRHPKQDVWNEVFGCATAGAMLTRNRESNKVDFFLVFLLLLSYIRQCYFWTRGSVRNGSSSASVGQRYVHTGDNR